MPFVSVELTTKSGNDTPNEDNIANANKFLMPHAAQIDGAQRQLQIIELQLKKTEVSLCLICQDINAFYQF